MYPHAHRRPISMTAITKKIGQEHPLNICYGLHDTPFGTAFIALTEQAICKLAFIEAGNLNATVSALNQHSPHTKHFHSQQQTKPVIQSIFSVEKKPLKLYTEGTSFQIKVWQALLEIGHGQLCCYQDIAKKIGKPNATRAVGNAIGANPIAFVIPCHRVITKAGNIGHYRWGAQRKLSILQAEGLNIG